MSEPIREEPTAPRTEGQAYTRSAPPQPLRPYEERANVAPAEAVSRFDLVHWAPAWAGMFVSIAVLLLLTPLGVAIGLSSGTGAAIWGFICLIVAFFVGGYVTGRTLSFEDSFIAAAHGLLAWAVALSFLVLATVLLGTIGAAGAAGAIRAPIALPTVVVPSEAVTGASLATFFAFLVSGIAAVAGAVAGNQARLQMRRVP